MPDTVGQNAEQLSELALIFAAAILRLHARQALGPKENSPESGKAPLEVQPHTALSVHTG